MHLKMDAVKAFSKLLGKYASVMVLSKNNLRIFSSLGLKISKNIEAQY